MNGISFCFSRLGWLCLTVSAGTVATAAGLNDFAGTWNVANFSIPSQLTLQKDQNGVVVNIPEAMNFGYSTGALAVQSNGTFAGNVPDPISGTAVPGAPGVVVLNLDGTNGPGAIAFNANAAADFMAAGGVFGGSSQDLILALRAPTAIAPAELAGWWNMQGFQTPAQLVLEKNSSNRVVNIQGLGQFQTMAGAMSLLANGTFSGNMEGPFTGTVTSATNGAINITVQDQSSTNARTLFVNAGKDLMVLVEGAFSPNDNYQDVLIFSKAPARLATSEAAGPWRVITYDAPQLTPISNPNGLVVDLNGRDGFGAYANPLVIGSDGYFWVQGDAGQGVFSAGANGLLTASVQDAADLLALPFYANAAKNIMTSITTRSWGTELLLATRAAAWPGPLQNFALAASTPANGMITIAWAAAPDRALQVSTDLITGETLTNTLGQHSYSEPATNAGPRQFRVRQPAP